MIRVVATPRGVDVELDGPISMSRTEAHRFAIALLQACVPGATMSTISLQLHGAGPDPGRSSWGRFTWR